MDAIVALVNEQGAAQQVREAGLALSRLWAAPDTSAASRPGPRPRLSLPKIVDAAVAAARADGLPAVSMTRVAEDVGCAKMALYRHVSSHQDLLSAMLDHALGDPPELVGSWRDRFRRLWQALLDLYARDPWLLELPRDTPALTPRNAAWINAALSVLADSTVPRAERLNTVLLITENIRFEARRRADRGRFDDLAHLFSSAAHASGELSAEQFPHLAGIAGADPVGGGPPTNPDQVRDLMLSALAAYFPEEDSS